MSKSEAAKPAAKTVRNMVPLKNMVQSSQSSRGKKSSQSIEEIAAATSRVRLSATFWPLPTLSSASVSHAIDASVFLKGRGRSAHAPGGRGGKKLMPAVPGRSGRRGKGQFAFSKANKNTGADSASIFEFDM